MRQCQWFLSNHFSLFGLIILLSLTGCASTPVTSPTRTVVEPPPPERASVPAASVSPVERNPVARPVPLERPHSSQTNKTSPTTASTPKKTKTAESGSGSAAKTSSPLSGTLAPRQTPEGLLITLDEHYFLADRMRIAPNQAASIQKIADLFQQYPHRQGKIEAIVNDSGSVDYLRGVSQRLADAVLYELVERGVESRRLLAQGLGARPLSATAPRGQMGQRQVTILLLP